MDGYLERRARLITSAEPGGAAAAELARMTDEAVLALAGTASSRASARWAIVALGGYGARRLLPASDIDLLVLAERQTRDLKPIAEAVLYPLWDAGLAVGHQVRSRKEHLAAVKDDLQVLTATLTGRHVAGDRALSDETLARCAADAHARRRRLLRDVIARERPGSPYLLEPDLKEGAGGQRDLDELAWVACVLARRPLAGLAPLVEAGLLGPRDVDRLRGAQELLTAARWDLQRARPRAGSRFTLDAVEDVRVNAELIQAALAGVHHTLLRVRRSLEGGGPTHHAALPLSRNALFELAGRGTDATDELEEAAWSGRLETLVPGIRALMTTRRPALSHTRTVGAHSLAAAALLAGLPIADPGLARSVEAVPDPRILVAAALAHDLGKAEGGAGHAERGAPAARSVALRLGLAEQAADDVALLVREHLLLAEAAASEDVDDEDTVLALAARVGERRLVPPLHVLTAADSLATGPGGWSAWQAAAVGKLVARVDAALSPDVDGAGLAARAADVRAEALAACGQVEPEAVSTFIERASVRYLASREACEAVVHARMVAALEASGGARSAETSVRVGPVGGSYEVSVAAADRPELFARIAGAFALSGLDILAAEAHAAAPGVALDVFVVRSASAASPASETWTAFERHLTAALVGRLDLAARLASRAADYRRRGCGVRPYVGFDTSRMTAAVMHVRAPDRVGLLHDVANEISRAGLDIRWVRALTRGHIADDVFHVVDVAGETPTDPGLLGHLSMRIREAAGT